MKILRRITLIGIATAATLNAANATAQSYPARPVKVIVPFATGAASDIIARQVFDRVGAALGQGFVVENRPGAGGTVGSEFVAMKIAVEFI